MASSVCTINLLASFPPHGGPPLVVKLILVGLLNAKQSSRHLKLPPPLVWYVYSVIVYAVCLFLRLPFRRGLQTQFRWISINDVLHCSLFKSRSARALPSKMPTFSQHEDPGKNMRLFVYRHCFMLHYFDTVVCQLPEPPLRSVCESVPSYLSRS